MRLPRLGTVVRTAHGVGSTLGVTVTLAAALLITASSASALPGPTSLSTGFVSDTLFFDDGQTTVWFPPMEQLGATWVRIPVPWNAIAPASPPPGFNPANPGDPHYNWFSLDRAVREAARSNLHALLMLAFPPSWALGPDVPSSVFPDAWRPDPNAYGVFAHAVAQRYSGHFPDPSQPGRALPRVRDFQAWNEPNLRIFLEPQWTRTPNGLMPASPAIYRKLLNSLYAAVKAVQPAARVLAAGLAPYGDRPGLNRMHPVAFLRELLCLHGAALRPEKCPNPAHFDAIDIHPYALTPTIHAFNADDVSVPDVGRLSRVLRVARRTHRALPRGRKAIWTTEVDWGSSPPDRLGIPLARQARYLAQAFYKLWLQGVSHVLWYQVRDPKAPAGTFTGAGLFFSSGRPKPATVAFRFPFVAIRGRHGMTTLWGHAPAAVRVTIDVAHRGRWRRLLRLSPTRGGVFYARRRLGAHLKLRARVGTIASYPWPTG